MKVIVGSGNPGEQYKNTRHNTGQLLVDQLYSVLSAQYLGGYGWRRKKDIFVAEFPDITLIKTAGVWMNESGRLILNAPFYPPLSARGGKLEDLYIAHDDLDLKLGSYKIQFGVGPKEHHGVQSVETALRTDQFWRVRIGIDNRAGEQESRRAGEEYVLQPFLPEERTILNETIENIILEINP